MRDLIVIPLSLLAGLLATKAAIRLFPAAMLRENFQKRLIPNAYGLFFVVAAGVYYASKCEPSAAMRFQTALAFLVAVLGFGLLGFIDDVAGDRGTGGLGGHFRALIRERRLTTGAIKAIGGVIFGFACSALTPAGHTPWLIRAIEVAGAANALNLVDLRPGRCLAVFGAAYIPLLAYIVWRDLTSPTHLFVAALPLHFALLCAAGLYVRERKALFMLGDTGSNAFGAVLGLGYATFAPELWQWIAAAAILAFHVWTERNSVSKLIEVNPTLRAIDRQIGVR